MRLAAFAAAFVLPFAVAVLPLASIAFSDGGSSEPPDQLTVTDVPASGLSDQEARPAMAYGNLHATPSTECDGTLTAAIEG